MNLFLWWHGVPLSMFMSLWITDTSQMAYDKAQSILISDCGKRHYMGCNMAVYIAPNMRLASKFCNKMTLLVLEV